jgi:hypothetical protein
MFDIDVGQSYIRPKKYVDKKYLTSQGVLPTIGVDPQIGIDQYGQGTQLKYLATFAATVLRLLYMIPGQYPSIPTLGIDIKRLLFQDFDKINSSLIINTIKEQCALLDVYIGENKIVVDKKMYNDIPAIRIQIQSAGGSADPTTSNSVINIGITANEANEIISETKTVDV